MGSDQPLLRPRRRTNELIRVSIALFIFLTIFAFTALFIFYPANKASSSGTSSAGAIVLRNRAGMEVQQADTRVVDFYELMGVPDDADIKTIKRAYYDLAMYCHPDRSGDDGHDLCVVLNDAYAILKDPVQREAYDAELAVQREDRPALKRLAVFDGVRLVEHDAVPRHVKHRGHPRALLALATSSDRSRDARSGGRRRSSSGGLGGGRRRPIA